jgi:hypothetical protein
MIFDRPYEVPLLQNGHILPAERILQHQLQANIHRQQRTVSTSCLLLYKIAQDIKEMRTFLGFPSK